MTLKKLGLCYGRNNFFLFIFYKIFISSTAIFRHPPYKCKNLQLKEQKISRFWISTCKLFISSVTYYFLYLWNFHMLHIYILEFSMVWVEKLFGVIFLCPLYLVAKITKNIYTFTHDNAILLCYFEYTIFCSLIR